MTGSANPVRRQYGAYKWSVVAMLWFICFFNYADRQALSAVFPLLQKNYGFTKEQLGLIGAAFTWVYALSAPFAGQTADRFARKPLILVGLAVWSIITGFTAACSRVWHFVAVRGAEGLGETFYFPASMSLISDYHTPSTRSQAMSLHQTSVYAGTIGGSAFAGWMGLRYGWSSSFVVLGAAGCILGLLLARLLREPRRTAGALTDPVLYDSGGEAIRPPTVAGPDEALRQTLSQPAYATNDVPAAADPERRQAADTEACRSTDSTVPMTRFLAELARTPAAILLILAFFGANFVALVFLTWMPTFLKEKFHLNLAAAGLEATIYIQLASMVGATAGGWMADRWRVRLPGGRILTQAVGALAGGPFIFLCGFTRDRATLLLAMTLFGLAKGLYDANIWAALYDVVTPSRRATAVGLMNMIGWLGGGLGAYAIGLAVTRWHVTMSQAIEATALVYVGVAALLMVAAFVFAPTDVRRSATMPDGTS